MPDTDNPEPTLADLAAHIDRQGSVNGLTIGKVYRLDLGNDAKAKITGANAGDNTVTLQLAPFARWEPELRDWIPLTRWQEYFHPDETAAGPPQLRTTFQPKERSLLTPDGCRYAVSRPGQVAYAIAYWLVSAGRAADAGQRVRNVLSPNPTRGWTFIGALELYGTAGCDAYCDLRQPVRELQARMETLLAACDVSPVTVGISSRHVRGSVPLLVPGPVA